MYVYPKPYIKMKLNCIIDLNVRIRTTKLLGKILDKNLCDFVRKTFLRKDIQSKKHFKMIYWISSKLKTSFPKET